VRTPSPIVVAFLVCAYAIASRVEFEVAEGSVLPTELVLVPMLFVLPVDWVPFCVAGGLLLGELPDYVRGRVSVARAPLRLVSSWHALGPALVFALAGERPPNLADWRLYVAALAAQLAFDFASGTLREWIAYGVSPQNELRFVAAAFAVDVALAPIGLFAAIAAEENRLAFLGVLPLIALLAGFARQRSLAIDGAVALGSAYRGAAELLVDFVEDTDAYTGDHSRGIVDLVLAVADDLGVDPRGRRDAELAALLHDVGKMRVPRELITKPSTLTPPERELMETHTVEGERMLARVGGLLGEVGSIVRCCHERWDGHGYPDRLAGDEIPLVARIVACCDAYSAMTTDRAYRRALSDEVALEELRAHAGTQFDPQVVDALVRVLAR
jgi:HD-GYP domain-containing protein (c-di-GMP phosphodiesterase class II)